MTRPLFGRSQGPWYHVPGVYCILHIPSGRRYIGSSTRSIGNRIGWHKTKLRHNAHTCPELMELWRTSKPKDFTVQILQLCEPHKAREYENTFQYLYLLTIGRPESGYTHSEEVKEKMREGRAQYLMHPLATQRLSDQAKRQHAARKFGYTEIKPPKIRRSLQDYPIPKTNTTGVRNVSFRPKNGTYTVQLTTFGKVRTKKRIKTLAEAEQIAIQFRATRYDK